MNDDARLVLPRAEYQDRLRAVRREMAARQIDLLIVDETEHLAYFRRLDEPALLERSWLRERVCFADTEDPVEAMARTITARGWAAARIGVETDSQYPTVQTYEALRRALPRATFVPFATVLRELRLRKSPREIEYLRQAAEIADQAMREAVAAVSEGVSERAAAIAASDFTRAFLPTAEWVLEPGMVFHMYTGARGMAFSETVLVTDGGAERLTRHKRCLFTR